MTVFNESLALRYLETLGNSKEYTVLRTGSHTS
jgi:hypothetical protein